MPSTTLGPASPRHPSLTASTEWIAGYVGPSLTLSLWMHDWSLIVFLQRERKPALWRGRAAVCVGEAAAVPLTGHLTWRMHGAEWRRKCARSVCWCQQTVSPDAAGIKSHHLIVCVFIYLIFLSEKPRMFLFEISERHHRVSFWGLSPKISTSVSQFSTKVRKWELKQEVYSMLTSSHAHLVLCVL